MKIFKQLLSLFLFFFITVSPVYAVLPCVDIGDEWFTNRFVIDQVVLPEGLEIKYGVNEAPAIVNHNVEPLYIAKESSDKSFSGSEVPGNFEPLFKLVSGNIFYYLGESSEWISLPSDYTRLSVNDDIVLLEHDPIQIYEDNRPANVEVPAPVNFKITAFYMGNKIEIPGKMIYSLNENYDPHLEENTVCRNYYSWSGAPIRMLMNFILVNFFVFSLFAMLFGICGIIFERLQIKSLIKWHQKILVSLLMIILAIFVYIDFSLTQFGDFWDPGFYSESYLENPLYLIIIGSIQIFTIFKLNDFILDWLKGSSIEGFKSATYWKKIFLFGMLCFFGVFVLYPVFSFVANLF